MLDHLEQGAALAAFWFVHNKIYIERRVNDVGIDVIISSYLLIGP